MNNTADRDWNKLTDELAFDPTTLRAATAPTIMPARAADNDESCAEPDDIGAWARHALAVNGFGDAPMAPSSRPEPDRSLRVERSRVIADAVAQIAAAVRSLARRLHGRYQDYRQARATYHALHDLDDRTLRDLGFYRDEIGSVAAEHAGLAEATRIRAVSATR